MFVLFVLFDIKVATCNVCICTWDCTYLLVADEEMHLFVTDRRIDDMVQLKMIVTQYSSNLDASTLLKLNNTSQCVRPKVRKSRKLTIGICKPRKLKSTRASSLKNTSRKFHLILVLPHYNEVYGCQLWIERWKFEMSWIFHTRWTDNILANLNLHVLAIIH